MVRYVYRIEAFTSASLAVAYTLTGSMTRQCMETFRIFLERSGHYRRRPGIVCNAWFRTLHIPYTFWNLTDCIKLSAALAFNFLLQFMAKTINPALNHSFHLFYGLPRSRSLFGLNHIYCSFIPPLTILSICSVNYVHSSILLIPIAFGRWDSSVGILTH